MQRRKLRIATAGCIVVLAFGCAPLWPTNEPEPAVELVPERADYDAAVALLKTNPRLGADALEQFLRGNARSSLADDAALELARIHRRAGSLDSAVRHLHWASRVHPRGDRRNEILLLLAELERDRGNLRTAQQVAKQIRVDRLPKPGQQAAYRLQADLAAERGDTLAQLEALAGLREIGSDSERLQLDHQLDALLKTLSVDQLNELARALRQRSPGARVQLRLAELALAAGNPDRARSHAERAREFVLLPDEAARLAALGVVLDSVPREGQHAAELPSFSEVAGQALPVTASASGSIGVVLPLTGSFARFGEECLRGILLASGVFELGPSHSPANIRVRVRDSGGNAEGAAAAVKALAKEGEVSAIVGPLLGSEAEAAARAAEDAGIPLLALTAKSEVAQGRPRVFRVGRAPHAEVEVLVDFALRQLEVGRFAILHPNDSYGTGLRDLFWDVVEQQGGRVVGVASYDPKDTDFAGPIRSMLGYSLLSPEEEEALEERERMMDRAKKLPAEEAKALREEARALLGPDDEPLPPIVNFDALFIPDSYDKVGLIAPQLAFHEVMQVRLLGPNGWYHPDLIEVGGRHVEGAVFTEAFYPESQIPFVADFTRRYLDEFGESPGTLAALSYDAANLIFVQLAHGMRTRDEIRKGLLSVQHYPGVSGVTSMLDDGNAQKRPYLLGVRRGRIQSLEPGEG